MGWSYCRSAVLSGLFSGLLVRSGSLSCISLDFLVAPPGQPWPFWSFSTFVFQEGQTAWVERKVVVCLVVCNSLLKFDRCRVLRILIITAESKPVSPGPGLGMGWVWVWCGCTNLNPHPHPHSTCTCNPSRLPKPMHIPKCLVCLKSLSIWSD